MRMLTRSILSFVLVFVFSAIFWPVHAQSNSGSISGAVTDPSGAVVPGATVTIDNPVSGYTRTVKTDSSGRFQFSNLPFNPYHLDVTAAGFGGVAQDADVRSTVPLNVNIALKLAGASTTVTVEGSEDLLENDPTFHTDVDRGTLPEIAPRKPVILSQFSGNSIVARRRRRLQRTLSWSR